MVVGAVVTLISMQPDSPEHLRSMGADAKLHPATVTLTDTVWLKETQVKNLDLQTAEVGEGFEMTEFALGRIEEIPSRRSVLSSRVAGRVAQLGAFVGDSVSPGQVLAQIESRQLGSEPVLIPLTAPAGGIVTSAMISLGQPVEPDAQLLEICDRSEMWAVAKIPDLLASSMEIGKSRSRLLVPAVGNDPLTVTLVRLGVRADPAGRTVNGIFKVPNEDGRFRPGMRVEFNIIAGERPDGMTVPLAALQDASDQPIVFVKDFNMPFMFVRAPVQIGEKNDRFAEITGGLFPGDEVVTEGSYQLSFMGDSVILADEFRAILDSVHCHTTPSPTISR